jgi:purine-binding chemotaxis protein CheW
MSSESPSTLSSQERTQYATFFIDRMMFGINVKMVQEVIRLQRMTPVPLAPETVEGLINLRGQIITALDLRTRLGLPKRSEEKPPMNVVVTTNEAVVSLLVDRIGDVVEVGKEQYEDTPDTLAPVAHSLVTGVYKLKDQLLLVLNAEKAVDVQTH